METTTKAEAEKTALEKRLNDLEVSANKRETDLKTELDMYKEKVESLQVCELLLLLCKWQRYFCFIHSDKLWL